MIEDWDKSPFQCTPSRGASAGEAPYHRSQKKSSIQDPVSSREEIHSWSRKAPILTRFQTRGSKLAAIYYLSIVQISINTPALLFPAITLLMLAYTNRFLALATLIRNLHAKYKQIQEDKEIIKAQIHNLKRRLNLVKQMQGSGITSFFFCVLSMLFFFLRYEMWAISIFGISLVFLLISLFLSLAEIYISTKALEIELKDMEEE